MSFSQNSQNNQNQTKKNLRQLLVQNLDNMINNESLNKKQIQIGGGKKYSQTELDNLTQQTVQYIGALFFQAHSDKNIVINQIEKLLKEKPYLFDMMDKLGHDMKPFEYIYKTQSNQFGGSGGKKYSQQQLDQSINNSIQQFLSLYIQTESEKQKLSTIYAKLVELSKINPLTQFGKTVQTSSLGQNKVPIYVSLKTLLEYLTDNTNKLYESRNSIVNIRLLSNSNYELSHNGTNYTVKILLNPKITNNKTKLNDELSKIFKMSNMVSNTTTQNDIIIVNKPSGLNEYVKKFLNGLKFISINTENIKVDSLNPLQSIIYDDIMFGSTNNKISILINKYANIKLAYDLIEANIIDIVYNKNGGLTKTLQ
jgi:hypothetical protein